MLHLIMVPTLAASPRGSSPSLSQLLDAIIASPTVPPSFDKCDILSALVFIGVQTEPTSRFILMEKLNLKEGPAKTLIRRFEQNGLVTRVGNVGHVLTTKGKEWNDRIRSWIVDFKEVSAPSVSLTESAYGIQLRGLSGLVQSGIEQRDHALLAGAIGATTLVFEKETLRVPSVSNKSLDKKAMRQLLYEFKLQEGDIVIIGMGRSPSEAKRGAFNAALSLLLRIGINQQ
jgi:hypothetical protein